MYNCMAAAGPVDRQAGWSGNPFLLPLTLPAGRFKQKRLQQKAGTKAQICIAVKSPK